MSAMASNAMSSGRRLSGPAQRAVRSEGTRGGAAQTFLPHPLEYQMYYTI
jgi:hypothetical protein